MINLAPIALFAYNRPKHLLETLSALENNELASECVLYIYCDGPKINASKEQLEKIHEVRVIAKAEKRFNNVVVIEREINIGLAANIITGVTEIVNKSGKIIVLEDDLVTSVYFLQYMNDALNYYEEHQEVACIHGYIYPIKTPVPESFFLKGADCWGWATWKRAWNLFEPNGEKLLDTIILNNLENEFDFNNSYPYVQMLKDQIAGLNESWAIRWYASAFINNKLVLYPGESLVQNIGHDGSGTHCDINTSFKVLVKNTPLITRSQVEVSREGFKAFEDYFKTLNIPVKESISRKVKNFLRELFYNKLP